MITVIDWSTSYSSEHFQSVIVDGVVSVSCRLGVPQGSALGPVLFSLYSKPFSDMTSEFCPCL